MTGASLLKVVKSLRLHKNAILQFMSATAVKWACRRASSNLPVPPVILNSPAKGPKPYGYRAFVFFPTWVPVRESFPLGAVMMNVPL